jgi:hypothetical protein
MLLVYSTLFISTEHIIVFKRAHMSEGPDAKIEVVYEGGVFKPLHGLICMMERRLSLSSRLEE